MKWRLCAEHCCERSKPFPDLGRVIVYNPVDVAGLAVFDSPDGCRSCAMKPLDASF
jgi:hypothetical protein